MYYSQKREWIKNGIFISIILLIAIFSTYFIYHKFQDVRSTSFNSESLDVTYHEKSGDQLSISRVTPVTDSVGLSSSASLITLKNNLTEKVPYQIQIADDVSSMLDIEEEEQIPKEEIRISIKAGKASNKIYSLSELENGILLEDTLNALESKTLSIRIWIRQDTVLPSGSNMYYRGLIRVVEEPIS